MYLQCKYLSKSINLFCLGYGTLFIFIYHRYLLAVAFFTSIYTGCQIYRQIHELTTGNNVFRVTTAALIDFVGDQVWHFLLS